MLNSTALVISQLIVDKPYENNNWPIINTPQNWDVSMNWIIE